MTNHRNPSSEQARREERWRSLMAAAQAGDQAAYAELLSSLLAPLRKLVYRRWHRPEDVEDVVQDILLSVHAVRHTYDSQRPFGPWLMSIASRRIMDHARKTYRQTAHETAVDVLPETFPDGGANSDQARSDDRADMRHALAGLSPGQKQAVELTKLRGLSLEEASYATGKSVASLKVAVHRALKEMRRALERKP